MAVALPAGSRVHLALKPVDMRKGFDGLAASVQQILDRDPFSGHLFLFRSRGGDRLKALWWDGSGLLAAGQGGGDHADAGAAGDADRGP